jgi:hypothetical protein
MQEDSRKDNTVAAHGCLPLPRWSPDLTPIEEMIVSFR